MFKRKRGIKLSYEQQGMVYFFCANYARLPRTSKVAIRKLCDEIAGRDSDALLVYLTKPEKDVGNVARNCFVSEKKLYKYRAQFYEEFWRRRVFEK